MPPKFLERSHFVIREAFFKKNSVICLKSNIFPRPQFLGWLRHWQPGKRYWQNVPKPAKTNLVFKFESHCKSIIPSCKSMGRSEAFNVNDEKKTWKSVSSWSKIWNRCLNCRNNSVILSLYWFKSMFRPVVRILFRQRKWTVSSPESCVFHKDNFNLNATYGVVILSDKSSAA